MRICTLASGSTGNCTYVETDNYKILIDVGKNKKYIVNGLKELEVDYKDIDYIFLTHTHDDHTSALKNFMKNHKAVLCITKEMFLELKDADELNNIMIYEDSIAIPNLNIRSYKMSHDTNDIRSFIITENNKSIVYITDTGYINKKYFNEFKDKDVYFMESNHDIELLNNGPYPDWLKQRVLSDVGHLSNKFAGIYLEKFITPKTKKIVLLHLSEKNNNEQVAYDTVRSYINDNIELLISRPNELCEVINL